MATKTEQTKARTEVLNSSRNRAASVPVEPAALASLNLKRNTIASHKGRSLHAPTKSLADAKAGKPGTGKKMSKDKTGPNGGEDQTTNGVSEGRGADGPVPPLNEVSRKSTRGSWAGGEKQAQLTRRTQRALVTPEARAARATSASNARTHR